LVEKIYVGIIDFIKSVSAAIGLPEEVVILITLGLILLFLKGYWLPRIK
jgi:hypothetical protein